MSSIKKKSKRRRSSLAPTRVVPALSPARGLCNQIDSSLSPEARLEQLSMLCLKCAIEQVSKESRSEDVREHLENVKEDLLRKLSESQEHKEAIVAACSPPDRLLPNPENIRMDESIKEIENQINSLKKEEEDWISFFRELDKQAEEAERSVLQLVLTPSDLTEEQRTLAQQYLPELPDLTLVKQHNNQVVQKICLLEREHDRNRHILETEQIQINKQLESTLNQLNDKNFSNLKSPRATVQNFSEFPTPPEKPLRGTDN